MSPRVGRLASWQRRSSFAVLAACASSGLVWWALLDGLGWPQPQLRLWWIFHGVSGALALLVLGAVLPHHIALAWRHRRNRPMGSAALLGLSLAALSALLLLYGTEVWRMPARWLHLAAGICALVAFPWHVLQGRRCRA